MMQVEVKHNESADDTSNQSVKINKKSATGSHAGITECSKTRKSNGKSEYAAKSLIFGEMNVKK